MFNILFPSYIVIYFSDLNCASVLVYSHNDEKSWIVLVPDSNWNDSSTSFLASMFVLVYRVDPC